MVLGVSFNSPDENAAFARKYGFGFKLLCDTNHDVAMAYGALDDPKSKHPKRISILIDAEGRVERVYDGVNPRDHAAQVLADELDA